MNDDQDPTIDHQPSTLVVQTAFLGDVVLTTPLLMTLAEDHGPVDVVTTPAAASLLVNHPAVHSVIAHDKRGSERGIAGILRLASRLRARGYTRAYLPHVSWRSGLATMLAGIPERIGFSDAPAKASYTHRVARPEGTHETARLLALAGRSGPARPALAITNDEQRLADEWLSTNGVGGRFVALAPGSVWGTKRWDKYPALAATMDLPVVVIGGPTERELAAEILAAQPAARSAVGAMPLRVSAALLARARALVTNDSLPLHLAQATGTPTVVIFGPTVPAFGFGPTGPHDVVVELDGLPCRPCSRHGPERCPLGHHRCMKDLDVLQVRTALDTILSD